ESRSFRKKLVHKPETLPDEVPRHRVDARHVPAGPVQARNEAALHRITAAVKDDRNGRCRSFGGKCSNKWGGEDQPHPPAYQIIGQFRQSLIVIKAPPVFNHHIAALGESTFAQAFAECRSKRRRRFGCSRDKDTNHWQLLRACRARHGERRCRTADEPDKFAPSHIAPPCTMKKVSDASECSRRRKGRP